MAFERDERVLPDCYLLFARFREFVGRFGVAAASAAATITVEIPAEQHLDCEGLAMLLWAATIADARGKRLVLSVPSAQARQVLEVAGLAFLLQSPAEGHSATPVPRELTGGGCARAIEAARRSRPFAHVSSRTCANRRHR